MRKLHLARLLSFVLVVALILNVFSFIGFIETDYASADTYYSSITAVGGKALLGQLHDLITTTHKIYTSYDNCKDPSIIIKTDPGTNGNVMEFYSQANISSKWGGGNQGTWNREHVWCQSLSNGLWGKSGGGGDLHHIRPAESGLNSARSNNKFGEVENGKPLYYEDSSNNPVALGGYLGGGAFEPLDNVKGDVARIVMYVYTHYNTYSNVGGTTNGSGKVSFGTLNFTHVVKASNEASAIAMLLEWNKLDPVDDIERTRNEAVYSIQGNRNPFIDDQTYADRIWGDSTVLPELVELSISPDEFELGIGQSKKLTVTPSPITADGRVTWESSDTSVATINSSGIVTAVGEGDAIITATSVANPEIDVLALVTVTKASTPVGGEVNYITITPESFNMTTAYGFKDWSAGGIGGFAFIYGGNSSFAAAGLQFNKNQSSYYLASNVAVNGYITSVTVKLLQGSERDWKLLTSNTAYTQVKGKPTNGNDQGTKTVTEEGVTWNVLGNDTYFALTYEQSGTNSAACYLESITIGYVSNGGTSGGDIGGDDDPEPKVEGLECTPSSVILDEEHSSIEDLMDKLTVKEVYSDGSKVDVDDYSIRGFDSSVFTAQEVTITYGGHSTTITVKIDQKDTPTPPTPPTPPTLDRANIDKFISSVSLIKSEGSPYQRYDSLDKAIKAYNALSADEKEDDQVKASLSILQSALNDYNSVVSEINQSSKSNTENAVGASGAFLLAGVALIEIIKKLL